MEKKSQAVCSMLVQYIRLDLFSFLCPPDNVTFLRICACGVGILANSGASYGQREA